MKKINVFAMILSAMFFGSMAGCIGAGSEDGDETQVSPEFEPQGEAAPSSCYDHTIAQPTAVHKGPEESTETVEFLNAGEKVTSSDCFYVEDTHDVVNGIPEQRWYMAVNYDGHHNNDGFGYIWVQRLSYGSQHDCAYSGHTHPIHPVPVPTGDCALSKWTP